MNINIIRLALEKKGWTVTEKFHGDNKYYLQAIVDETEEQLHLHSVVKHPCNCYADQWDKKEDNTIYCTGCGKEV